ncbi:hypothetical protein C9374_003011 [Naegleria lovaniensis]|uniref:Uncharacterized protein n=1 Tax=Naegleria lovaniensis TaxID=51637 RepID=A0AA88GRT3_NAELO|nr:uncharacterized protein C9374_003011 [Naegleria lovaniensis]KAG2385862.1 hypothetical protein C9374_003011 [Naegleria lovaniensis]
MRVFRSVNNFARQLYTRGHDAHAHHELSTLTHGPPSKKASLIFLGSLTVVPTVLCSLWYITYVGNPFTRAAQKKE